MERNYRIVAICDPYNARFHYRGQEVLRYDGATPVEWVMEDDLTEQEAYEILDEYAHDLNDVWLCDDDFVNGLRQEMIDDDGLTEREADERLSWYTDEGYYLDEVLVYRFGDDSLRDDTMLYRIEKK